MELGLKTTKSQLIKSIKLLPLQEQKEILKSVMEKYSVVDLRKLSIEQIKSELVPILQKIIVKQELVLEINKMIEELQLPITF